MWEKVSAADAVSSANNGQVVLACNLGHVAVVIPGGSGSNVRIAQAGATNGKNMSVDTGFGSQTRYYFRYKGSVTPSTTNNNSNSYSPPATPGQQRQYIIKAGDTLTAIAQRELGNPNRWREIVKTPSGGTFTEAEARQLRVGQSVYLPVSYQSGSATPVASAPSARPIVNSDIRWMNFSGTVGPSIGVNLRNSTRFSDRSSRNEPNGKRLEFDAWTYGEVGTDMWNGNQDARWFKVKGTNLWVPSAYIYGNPPNSTPMPSGSSGSNSGGGSQSVVQALRTAIIGQESGYNYKAVNPDSGALGFAQIMPFNIGPWSREALGYEITRAQFLNSPDLQLKIIDYKLNQYYQNAIAASGGNMDIAVRRVASAWYSGDPNLYANTRPQYYNGNQYPSIAEYTLSVLTKFRQAYGSGSSNNSNNSNNSNSSSNAGLNLVNFTGSVMPPDGVARRNSPNFSDKNGKADPNGKVLSFDAWMYGETGTDYQLGTPDARWFRIAGTNEWVPSAYINGNPPNSTPMPNGSNPIPESKTPSPLPKDPSHEDYQTLVSKAYSSYTKGQAVGVDDYTVNEIFGNPDSGFYALGLYSDTKPPVFVIRGTGDGADIFDDTNPPSIGYGQFSTYQSQILAWLEKAGREKGRTPDITGHSLGGAIAQLVAANFPTKVKQVVTFNSPGISRSMANHFSTGGGNKNDVTHYIVSGDLVSMAGEAYIAGRVSLISYLDIPNDLKAVNPISEHLITLEEGVINNQNLPSFYKDQNPSLESWLSNPLFYYLDPDYLVFLLAVAKFPALGPQLAILLLARGTTESSRSLIGQALRTIQRNLIKLANSASTIASVVSQISQIVLEQVFDLMRQYGQQAVAAFAKIFEFGKSIVESAINLILKLGSDAINLINEVAQFGKDMLQNVFDLLQKANNRAPDVLNAVITAAKVSKAALEAAIGLWRMIMR